MNTTSLRLTNLLLILGVLVINIVFSGDPNSNQKYSVILLAVWSILHTYQLQRTQDWRIDFLSLSPTSIKLFQYTTTVILVGAALLIWQLPIEKYPLSGVVILLISSGTTFTKLVLTPN